MLLNLKQSIHVEKQLGAVGNPETTGVHQPVDPTTKQLLKARMLQQQQKRLNKTRLQLFRQQVGIPLLWQLVVVSLNISSSTHLGDWSLN